MAAANGPHIPGYWMDETGGELASAVGAYIKGERFLTLRELALMRAYVKQWILSPVWDENPFQDAHGIVKLKQLRADAGRIASEAALDAWLDAAVEQGFDPL